MKDVTLIQLERPVLLRELRYFLWTCFDGDDHLSRSPEEYRKIIANAQTILNDFGLAKGIAGVLRTSLCRLSGSLDLMVQSNLYLRAARPISDGQEAVGWHRESFYGCQPQALNVWMPVMNCTPENSMKYIPGSASIPDEKIITEQDEAYGVEKGSVGHKVGLLYAPKRIVGGVDLSKAVPLVVPEGSVAIFSSALIHGAAVNRGPGIRFSIDFRVIAKEHVGKQKKSFAGEGQDFFVPLAA